MSIPLKLQRAGVVSVHMLCVLVLLNVHAIVGWDSPCSGDIAVTVNADADVMFTVIMTIRERSDAGECAGPISDRAIQNIALIQWTVDRINAGNFVDGVTIGFVVQDDCGEPRKAIAHAQNVVDGFVLGTSKCRNSVWKQCRQIGIIGTSHSNTLEAMLYSLQGTSLPVLSPYTTYPRLSRYDNFYRTLPTDDLQIQAIVDLLKTMGLTYVAVVHADEEFGKYAAHKLVEVAKTMHVCVDVVQSVQTGSDIQTDELLQQSSRTRHHSLTAVFFGRRAVMNAIFRQLQITNIQNISWIVAEHTEDTSGPLQPSNIVGNTTLSVSHSSQTVAAIQEYVTNKWNNILSNTTKSNNITDALDDLMACYGADKTEVPEWYSENVLSSIDAIFVLTSALQRQRTLYCSTKGICEELKGSFDFKFKELKDHPIIYSDPVLTGITVPEFAATNRTVDFDNNGNFLPNPASDMYDIDMWPLDAESTKIGTFHNNFVQIDMTSTLGDVQSVCGDTCPGCAESNTKYAYIDGEILLLGLFALHEGGKTDPPTCSESRISQTDTIAMESFLHSVDTMRRETQLDLGAIVLDTCHSVVQIEMLLTQLLYGSLKLKKPNSNDSVDFKKVLVAFSAVDSETTEQIYFVLTKLRIPLISVSASSSDLDDRLKYPHILRTVPSEEEQLSAMVTIIHRMKWKYVSLLYSQDYQGKRNKQRFVQLAKQNNICVADPPESIGQPDETATAAELSELFKRLENQTSDIVIYLAHTNHLINFLNVINGRNRFIFLAGDSWGNQRHILDNAASTVAGSMTLIPDIAHVNHSAFYTYIKHINPTKQNQNPWFDAYWEETFKCDLTSTYRTIYDIQCDVNTTHSAQQVAQFLQQQKVLHTIDAVGTIFKGLIQSKTVYCKDDDSFPCDNYHRHIDGVVQKIRDIKINRGGSIVRLYTNDGNGDIGYRINNIQRVSDENGVTMEYKEVGSYDEGVLKLDESSLKFYKNTVDGACWEGMCTRCTNNSVTPPVTMLTPHDHLQDDGFRVPDYAIIGILAFLFVMTIIICVIIICFFKRRIEELEKQLKKTSYEIKTGYCHHSTTGFNKINGAASVIHSDRQIQNSPSTATSVEYTNTQQLLNDGRGHSGEQTPNGVVNKGFLNDEGYLTERSPRDENRNKTNIPSANIARQVSPRGTNRQISQTSLPDSPEPRPSASSYGLSSNSSFKRVSESGGPHVKKQPRTQLAVPPCRPEQPGREGQNQTQTPAALQEPSSPTGQHQYTHYNHRPTMFPETFGHLPTAVPKEKVRKTRSSPKRTVSPPSLKHAVSSAGEQSRYSVPAPIQSPLYNNIPSHLLYPSQDSQFFTDQPMVNVGGSLEKISRV